MISVLPANHSILLTAASFGWTVEAAAADRLRSTALKDPGGC